jgi:MFS family permease
MAEALLRRNRNFRLVFTASTVSNLGDGVSALAFPWLATLLTRDPFLISLVAMAGRLPWFLFALPAGVWTDRADRRRLMVRADLVRMVLTLGVVTLILSLPTLPLHATAGYGAILGLATLAFLLGAAEVIRDNAAQTILPSVVAREDLERANGQMWSAEQVMNQFVGPPLAGALIALGIALPFGLDAATFAAAAALIWLVALPPQALPVRRAFGSELREGFAWLRGHPLIFRLAIILGITNAVFTAAIAMLALYSQEILHLDAFRHGLLLTAGAAGGVLAGLVGPRIAERLGPDLTVHMAMITFAAGYLALGLFPSLPVAVFGLFADAFGGILWNIVTVSYRQRTIPADILGRVNSIYRFFGWGMMPLGAVAGGLLVRLAEPALGREAALLAPFTLAGIVTLALTVYGFFRIRFPG